MKRNIELVLKGIGRLELDSKLFDKLGLEVNYTINDISDISEKKSNYTKAFDILGTPNNNKKMEHAYDINFLNNSYSYGARQGCYLMLNKNIIVDGYMQILSIKKEYIAGKYQVVYRVKLNDSSKDLFATIDDRRLQDLNFEFAWNFRDTTYGIGNHTFSIGAVAASQNKEQTYTNIYDYCLINYNYDGVNSGNTYPNDTSGFVTSKQFYPSLYLKAVIDRIFYEADWKYDSLFLDGLIFDGSYLKLATIYNGSLTEDDLPSNNYLEINNYLPDISQGEFLKGIMTQFNLFVEKDSSVNNTVRIDPRDYFYSSGTIKDWSDKIDDTTIKIEPMHKLVKKEYQFNMKENENLITDNYKDFNGIGYGSKKLTIEQDYLTGVNKVESIFGGYGFYSISTSDGLFNIPNFVKEYEDNIDTEKREYPPLIGYIKKIITSPYTWNLIGNLTPPPAWNSICHILDTPVGGYDLNFETKGSFYNFDDSYTLNYRQGLTNLFNTNNRLITQMALLNIEDIINLSFKDPILIDRELYYLQGLVNNINDFDAGKITLIKAFDYNNVIIPDVKPVIVGKTYLGTTPLPSGVGRPTASVALLETGTELLLDYVGDIQFDLYNINYYNWYAIPTDSTTSQKNFWFVDTYNQSDIGGGVNLAENLFPDPDIINFNGIDYYVWIANYQTGPDSLPTKITFKY